MANLTLASAALDKTRQNILAVITGGTLPLKTSSGTYFTGFTVTVGGVSVTVNNVPVPSTSTTTVTIPLAAAVPTGAAAKLTAGTNNVEDNAGTPLLLSPGTVNVADYIDATTQAVITGFASGWWGALLVGGQIGLAKQRGNVGNEWDIYGPDHVTYCATAILSFDTAGNVSVLNVFNQHDS
jgi:hypothetical protein